MKTIQKQHGAVLIISMIILLLLTILGITSMRTTQLEERMAGNARDRHVAFEAAEAGLLDAETFVQTIITDTPFDLDGSDGLYNDDGTFNDIKNYVDWSGTDPSRSFLTATNIGSAEGVTSSPKYVIQALAKGQLSQSSNQINPNVGGGYNNRQPASTANSASTLVRITVRGTGGSDNSVVFLQTVFGVNNF